MNPKRAKALIVGHGRALQNYSRIISQHPQFELVETHAFKDEAELAQFISNATLPTVDVAIVCCREEFSFKLVQFFLKKNIPTFMDHPLGRNSEECEKLIELSSFNKTPLYVGYPERFNPVIQKLKEVIGGGWLGELIHFEISRVNRLGPSDNIRTMEALAAIDIDILNSLCGEFEPLSQVLFQTKNKNSQGASLFLKASSGISASLNVNLITPVKIRKMRITGSRGYCDVDYILQTCTLYGGQLLNRESAPSMGFDEFLENYKSVDEVKFGVTHKEPMVEMMTNFYNHVFQGDPAACPLSDAAYAVYTAIKAVGSQNKSNI